MRFPASLVALVWLLRHEGWSFFRKYARYVFYRDAWLWLLRGGRHGDLAAIRSSRWFDPAWYLREYVDVRNDGIDPALHFAAFGNLGSRDPGPDFCVREYYELNEDARRSGMNPLAHFERLGRRENRPISFLQLPAASPSPAPPPDYDMLPRIRENHPASFTDKIENIRRARVEKGLPVRAAFFVSLPSMFPARPLFEAMRRDPAFDARIVVVPDLRWLDRDPDADMEACRAELRRTLPSADIRCASPGADGTRPDVSREADIVVYPIVYAQSDIRYNPRWAVGRPFLPVYVNYGVPISFYGRDVMTLQGYAYFWKVFLECSATAGEYAASSCLGGANAEVVGTIKMDGLATAVPWPRNGSRRRVLLAPHHSVNGGANDILALSNFERYSDFFLALPGKHPELDFVFRPHPFLFAVLSNPSKWGRAKVDSWIARMKSHPNVRWSDEGDYLPAFVSCDACIQDCASFLFEWLFTGKPGCYMLKSPDDPETKFSPFGRECLACYHLAYDEAGIEAFLRDVVAGGSDSEAAARGEFRKSVMVNYPHAADAALGSIKRSLGIV